MCHVTNVKAKTIVDDAKQNSHTVGAEFYVHVPGSTVRNDIV
jgi:hypothetical protein